MTSQDAFFIVLKFWFSQLLGGYKGKKWPKITKNSVCFTPYIRNCTSYDCGFWCNCVKWWYLQQYSSFFQNSDFLGFWGGRLRGKKWPIIANFSLSHSITQELKIISWRLLVHRYKIVISPGVFLYFFYFFNFCKY